MGIPVKMIFPDLFVLPPVEDGPGDLPWIPPEEVSAQAPPLQEPEGLPVGLDEGPAPARVDLVPAVTAQVDPETVGQSS